MMTAQGHSKFSAGRDYGEESKATGVHSELG